MLLTICTSHHDDGHPFLHQLHRTHLAFTTHTTQSLQSGIMHACTAHVLVLTAHAPHTTGMNYACTAPTALNLALVLSMKPQKTTLPTPFLFCYAFSPSFFPLISFLLSCLSPHAWPCCCTVRFNCSCFSLASGITFFAKIYVQGTVGLWHIRLENVCKKKEKKKLANVPRQGIGKRAQAGHQQASQAGTGKCSQAGNWQAYAGRVLASIPGRDCTETFPGRQL